MTSPRAELLVLEQLVRRGFVAYLPLIARERARRVRGTRLDIAEAADLPMFPRYAFVLFDRHVDPWQRIWSTYGVSRLISSSATMPLPLPDGAIEDLILRVGETGTAGRAERPGLQPLAANTRARITTGPWADLEVLVTRSAGDRVRVLVEMFGRATEATLKRTHLVAV